MMRARDIMTPNPQVVTGAESVIRAAEIMRDLEVGFVPVVDERRGMRLRGVITDRDIAIRHVAEKHDRECRVEQHMSTESLATVRPDADVSEVHELMKRNQVRRLPVTDENGRIVGVIAQADVAVKEDRPGEISRVVEKISEPARPAYPVG